MISTASLLPTSCARPSESCVLITHTAWMVPGNQKHNVSTQLIASAALKPVCMYTPAGGRK